MKTWALVSLAVVSLGLIGWGAWMLHPALAPLTVGILLWLDLVMVDWRRKG